jgi:hypothetical protein
MNDTNPVPVKQLSAKETLCLLMFHSVIFDSEHLKEKTLSEVNGVMEFLFTKEMVDEILDLNAKRSKQEIQLILHRFT